MKAHISNENSFEEAIEELFLNLDYDCYCGYKIERDEHNPLYMDELIDNIARINPDIPSEAIDKAINIIQNFEAGSLEQKNDTFLNYLQNGVKTEYIKNNEPIAVLVKLIDFKNPFNNQFTAIRQWTVVEHQKKRPDVVVFVNGLPLVVIELKSPSREDVDSSNGYRQINTYKDVIPTLFNYNAFCVISDQAMSKAGTITANEDRYMEWKTVDGDYEETKYASFDTLFEGMFEKNRFIDLLKNFILSSKESTKITRILAGYHQYYAVHKAVESTLKGIETDHKGGVFWHTQGSGKSLSMVFYVHLLNQILDNPTFVILTDRNDLDNQLYSQFTKCKDFLRQTPVQAETKENLRELLNNKVANGIIFSTIQKFDEYNESFTDREDVIVIADEAHRSQYGFETKTVSKGEGLELKKGLAQKIRDALPNATFIGFTGTPIAKKDKNTQEVFGDYIDIYDMTQSVEDGATVPIHYESRVVKLKLDDDVLRQIDEKYLELSARTNEYTIERSKRQESKLEVILGADDTITALCEDIVNHYENNRQQELTGKAMIVAYNRRIAIKIYKKILELRPDWTEKVNVVMSSSNNDTDEWRKIIGTDAHKKQLENKFKDDEDPFKIAIVRDMWLTGFDVPSLATMYIYKPMDGHNLMQTIARVNRVYPEKKGGLIVDYIGISSALKEAMQDYTKRDKENYSEMDVSKEAYPEFQTQLEICKDLMYGFDYSIFFTGTALQRSKIITDAANFVEDLDYKPGVDTFLKETTKLLQAASICRSLTTEEERIEEAFYKTVRSLITKITRENELSLKEINSQIDELLKQSLHTTGVVNLFSDVKEEVSLFDENFLEQLKKMETKNISIQILQNLLKDKIRIHKRKNIIESEEFSELLTKTMNQYINRHITNEEVIQELIKLAHMIKKSKEEGNELGLDDDEQAFYSAIVKPEGIKDFYQNDELIQLTHELTEQLRKNQTIDWQKKKQARATMKVNIKRLLKKYKYPPDEQKEAIEIIITQCENWADNIVYD
ncbi:MAG: type I restriction endonuclease subunit R [Methanobrevibacter olleyae]|uniref:type I site-specific deoxyribonuclease n=1 Tax=Methanobrevibacter olleyae TaxID=294671 RepID=A0A8T3VZX7_METOL|nr:type I restriction endonuclease subunit R [Methanobrevibacter olleyae]